MACWRIFDMRLCCSIQRSYTHYEELWSYADFRRRLDDAYGRQVALVAAVGGTECEASAPCGATIGVPTTTDGTRSNAED